MGLQSWTRLSAFTFTFHFCVLEKEMATPSSVLAWRIPGTAEPGGLPSVGLLRVGHDWSNLAAATAAAAWSLRYMLSTFYLFSSLLLTSGNTVFLTWERVHTLCSHPSISSFKVYFSLRWHRLKIKNKYNFQRLSISRLYKCGKC